MFHVVVATLQTHKSYILQVYQKRIHTCTLKFINAAKFSFDIFTMLVKYHFTTDEH